MNLNKVIICGNATRDPELRQTPSGQNVCDFAIATNQTWNDKEGKKVETEFHNIVVFGNEAVYVNQTLKKGNTCLIEGRLKTRVWETRGGEKKNKTEIIAENIQIIKG